MSKLFILLLLLILVITISLSIYCLIKNIEQFKNDQDTIAIKHFITKLNLYIPKFNNWNDDLILRWKKHVPLGNKEILNILNNIADNTIIIEAGGHIGDTTFFMSTYLSSINKNCLIYTFEPDINKCNYMKLISKLNNSKNIIIFNVGISD